MIDLLVNLLQCPLREGDEESHMIRIFKEAYDVLHAYMIGKSRKNALYFAKYIDFFQTQFTQKVNIYFCNLCMYNHDNKFNNVLIFETTISFIFIHIYFVKVLYFSIE